MNNKYKKTIMVEVMGIKFPMYQDCNKCGSKLTVRFEKVAYNQPCDKCKSTKEYQDERRAKDKQNRISMDDALKANKPAGIWQYKNRTIITNNKGDIIRDEPYKPLPVGKKDWK